MPLYRLRVSIGNASLETCAEWPFRQVAECWAAGTVALAFDLDADAFDALDKIKLIARQCELHEVGPIRIRREAGASFQSIVLDLLAQARERQKSGGGAMIIGTVMQHLVGAKLEIAMEGRATIEHHGANTSDQGGRGGDFDIGDTAIHVTSTPGELLIEKCRANLGGGLRPVIVTSAKGVAYAADLADQKGIGARVDVHAIEQFLALNILELGAFDAASSTISLRRIIGRYNEIINEHEANPSLRIEWS